MKILNLKFLAAVLAISVTLIDAMLNHSSNRTDATETVSKVMTDTEPPQDLAGMEQAIRELRATCIALEAETIEQTKKFRDGHAVGEMKARVKTLLEKLEVVPDTKSREFGGHPSQPLYSSPE